ncbi:MAG: hypothetical protein AB1778_04895, partial [Candidatus Bipolaricaulota bacterium]
MLRVHDLVESLLRRHRRLRGLAAAAAAFGAVHLVALVAFGALRLAGLVEPFAARLVASIVPWIAAPAAFLLARRRALPTPFLLFDVDVRLGLAARLSSLYELGARTSACPPEIPARLLRELEQLDPPWRNALRPSRRDRAIRLAAASLGCAAMVVAWMVPARFLEPAPGGSGISAAAVAPEVTGPSPVPDSGTGLVSPPPPASRPLALADVLAELRPAQGEPYGLPDASAATLSPGSASPTSHDLEAWRDRLSQGTPLGSDEAAALRAAAASLPLEARDAIDDALAVSDLDALRRSIEQILPDAAEPAPPT